MPSVVHILITNITKYYVSLIWTNLPCWYIILKEPRGITIVFNLISSELIFVCISILNASCLKSQVIFTEDAKSFKFKYPCKNQLSLQWLIN